MFESKNIKDYIAKAVVFKDEITKAGELKDKFARFTILFPTIEDKMICKAVFDVMFTSELKARKFIAQMVDGINVMIPQKVTEMIDAYNQATVLIHEKMKEADKLASETGGERLTEEEKQGSSKFDERHGRTVDPFIVMNAQDPNREFLGGEIIEQKGDTIISTISKNELEKAQQMNVNLQEIKREKEKREIEEELKRRAIYEKILAERRNKKQFSNVASELQRVYKDDD